MSMNKNEKFNRSLLNCLTRSFLIFVCVFTAACGDGSQTTTSNFSATETIAGIWILTSINDQAIDAADAAVMQVETVPSTLGCDGNLIARAIGSQVAFGGINAYSGCFISFPHSVQVNRDAVRLVLLETPTATLESGNLVIHGASSKLVFAPQN
jgi:hypothetical protein